MCGNKGERGKGKGESGAAIRRGRFAPRQAPAARLQQLDLTRAGSARREDQGRRPGFTCMLATPLVVRPFHAGGIGSAEKREFHFRACR